MRNSKGKTMRNTTVKSLLQHAAFAIQIGKLALAHSLVCNAERIAAADRTISATRLGSIRTARLALAVAL
ncbi:hypothetical protein [Bradyrhizobium cenepequi]